MDKAIKMKDFIIVVVLARQVTHEMVLNTNLLFRSDCFEFTVIKEGKRIFSSHSFI